MFGIVLAQGGTTNPPTIESFEDVFANLLGQVLPFVGIILFVMLSLGGLYYITSSGDPAKTSNAQKTLTYAIAGVVVIALSYLILRLIANFTGNQDILFFDLYREAG
jgi:putative copper export protein